MRVSVKPAEPLPMKIGMRRLIGLAMAFVVLCGVARGATITTTCVGGDSEEDFNLALETIRQRDQDAFLKLCFEGRAEAFEAGEQVSLGGLSGLFMVKVRKFGGTRYFLVPIEYVSGTGK
jgi:hypothetical protein